MADFAACCCLCLLTALCEKSPRSSARIDLAPAYDTVEAYNELHSFERVHMAEIFQELRRVLGVERWDPALVLDEVVALRNRVNEAEEAYVRTQRECYNQGYRQDSLQGDLEIKGLVETIEVLERQITQLNGADKQSKAENCQLQTTLRDIRLDFDRQIGLANRKLQQTQQNEALLKAQLAEEKSNCRNLENALKVANEQCTVLQQDLQTSSQQYTELQTRYGANRGRMQLEEELRQSQQNIQQLKKGQATLNRKISCLKEEAVRVQREAYFKRSGECSVCLERKSDTLFQPCGHVCVCDDCSARLTTCPMCGVKIGNKQKLFYS